MTFEIGDRVIIVDNPIGKYNKRKYSIDFKGKYGTVDYVCGDVGIIIDYEFNPKSESGRYYFDKKDVRLIDNEGVNSMEKITGNYRVAKVRHLNQDTTKQYAFALFDNNVNVGDNVLCDTQYGYNVAVVDEIISKDGYFGTDITREIICKVDFTEYNNRVENRKRANELKRDMDKKVKELQGIALYKMMAENCPELATMLEEYQGLVD